MARHRRLLRLRQDHADEHDWLHGHALQGLREAGSRKLEDLNATQLADVRKNLIGLVFQKFYLVPHLTAVENVMVAQYYHSVVDEKQAMEALERSA